MDKLYYNVIKLAQIKEKPPLMAVFPYIREEEKSLLAKENSLALVNYIFDLPHRQIKLLRKWLITNTV